MFFLTLTCLGSRKIWCLCALALLLQVTFSAGFIRTASEDKWRRGSMPFLPQRGAVTDYTGLLRVNGLPTGFLRIGRHVLEKMTKDAPSFYKQRDTRSKVPVIFERTLEDEKRWGGDLNFCNNARKMGFKLFALPELRLGHAAKAVVSDSLGAHIRRVEGKTLKFIADAIKAGVEKPQDFYEAVDYANNPWGVQEDVLMTCVKMARECGGPIIEAGSGLTTVLMAAANPDHLVYCLEHDAGFAQRTVKMAEEAGVTNIAIVHAPIKNDWYAIESEDFKDLPQEFGLCVVDGPPRELGDRMGVCDWFANLSRRVVFDDADNDTLVKRIKGWALMDARPTLLHEGRLMVIGSRDDVTFD